MWSCSNVRGGLAPARPPLSPPLPVASRCISFGATPNKSCPPSGNCRAILIPGGPKLDASVRVYVYRFLLEWIRLFLAFSSVGLNWIQRTTGQDLGEMVLSECRKNQSPKYMPLMSILNFSLFERMSDSWRNLWIQIFRFRMNMELTRVRDHHGEWDSVQL